MSVLSSDSKIFIPNQNSESEINQKEKSKCSPLYKLPDEIWLQIFDYLPMADQLNASSVSKKWNNLAEDNALWEERAVLLGLANTEENNPVNYKKSIISLCKKSVPIFQNAKEVMDENVLTGDEFDDQYSDIFMSNESDDEENISNKEKKVSEYSEKLNAKLVRSEILKRGFNAGISMYKFKPSYTESLYQIAKVLDDKHGYKNVWLHIAVNEIQNNPVEALRIFNTYLINSPSLKNDFYSVYIQIMSHKDIETAIQFFKDHPLNPHDWQSKEIISTILNNLFRTERYDLIEQGIDEKLWTDPMHILSLLRQCQKEDYQKRIVKKYQEVIENSGLYYLKWFLPYLLKCNSSSYCFKLFENHEMGKMDYCMIQDYFEGINGNVEYNKIEQLIKSAEK